MTIDREELVRLLLEVAREFNAEGGAQIDVSAGSEAVLFGRGATIDSLGLVRVIVAAEQAMAARYGVELTLANEQALSLRHSPFRTLGSLADYAAELLKSAET